MACRTLSCQHGARPEDREWRSHRLQESQEVTDPSPVPFAQASAFRDIPHTEGRDLNSAPSPLSLVLGPVSPVLGGSWGAQALSSPDSSNVTYRLQNWASSCFLAG